MTTSSTTASRIETGGRQAVSWAPRAAAPDAGFLVVARLAQGIGAGIMAPNVLAIIGTAYAGPARVKAVSAYGIVMGVAAAGGQLLGGVLIDANLAGLGWRVIF